MPSNTKRQTMLRKKTPIFDAPQSAATTTTTKRNYNVSILLNTSLDPL